MVREICVQSQVASYQRLLKWYLIPPCLTLRNIRCILRVKWSKLRNGVAPSPTPWYSSYWKGSLLVALDYGRQLYFYYLIQNIILSVKIKFTFVMIWFVWLFNGISSLAGYLMPTGPPARAYIQQLCEDTGWRPTKGDER